jgi:uncharacterized membrane protein
MEFSQLLAEWHPRLVPFPIVLLLTALLLDGFGVLLRNERAHWAGKWLMLVGTSFLLLAFICGICAEIWAGRAAVPHFQIEVHELGATLAAWGFIALTAWRLFLEGTNRRTMAAYVVTGLLLYSLVATAGYLGGKLVQDYGASVSGASANTVASLHDLNTLAQRQTDRNLQYSDLMHRSSGWLVLLLTLSLFVRELKPEWSPKLWWVMPTLMLGGGVMLFFFADLDLYQLSDPRQFMDREAQLHKLLAIILTGVGIRGFWKHRKSTATAQAAGTNRVQNRLIAIMALVGGGALFTHIHTVAPYADVAAGVYLNHIAMGTVALAIGASKLLEDARPNPGRWRRLLFPSLLLVETFLLITYTEGIPWWAGIGHYNRWGPHGGDIAPFGKFRAELLYSPATGKMDVYVLDRFEDKPVKVPATNVNVVVARRYQTSTVPLAGDGAHFTGQADFLKDALQFDAHVALPVGGKWTNGYFDPWVIPGIVGIPPNEVAKYVCPMHEGIRSQQSGDCKLCGMPLIPYAHNIKAPLHDPQYTMDLERHGNELRFIPRRNGEMVKNLRVVHEHLLHLIIVSDDLVFFDHQHPVLQPDSSFTYTYKFPHDGNFILYADITPAGERSQVFRLLVTAGNAAPKKAVLTTPAAYARDIGEYHVTMMMQPRTLTAERDAHFIFRIEQNGKPVLDLQPYIGAMGHCVILSEDTQRYLHCHPEQFTAAPPPDYRDGPEVSFHTIFPEAGRYKVWGQFKRGDEIIVADFVVNVEKPFLPLWVAKILLAD